MKKISHILYGASACFALFSLIQTANMAQAAQVHIYPSVDVLVDAPRPVLHPANVYYQSAPVLQTPAYHERQVLYPAPMQVVHPAQPAFYSPYVAGPGRDREWEERARWRRWHRDPHGHRGFERSYDDRRGGERGYREDGYRRDWR